jgi:large subunit ribosomal protein L33
MAKTKSVAFQFECSECKSRNYTTSKNPAENKEKLELSKFCNKCRKHTPHKEVKIAKAKK